MALILFRRIHVVNINVKNKRRKPEEEEEKEMKEMKEDKETNAPQVSASN